MTQAGDICYHPHMSSRRDFLSGKALREKLAESAEISPPGPVLPVVGNTVRLGTPAMASDFEVILNPGPASRLETASAALDLLEPLENQGMSSLALHGWTPRSRASCAIDAAAATRPPSRGHPGADRGWTPTIEEESDRGW